MNEILIGEIWHDTSNKKPFRSPSYTAEVRQLYCSTDAEGAVSFSIKLIVRVQEHRAKPYLLGEFYPNYNLDSSAKAVSEFCADMYNYKKERAWRTMILDRSWLEDIGYWCFSKDIE